LVRDTKHRYSVIDVSDQPIRDIFKQKYDQEKLNMQQPSLSKPKVASITVEWSEPRKAQVKRSFAGAPGGGKRKSDASSGVVGALRTLEEKYLRAGTKFACGDAPCIADLSVVPPLLLLNVAGVVLPPAVAAYVSNFEAHFGEKYAAIQAPLKAWVESKKEAAMALGLGLVLVGA
jgi:hypothetical protein